MREFSFRLEKMLELREYAEKQKSLVLAEVTGRYLKKEAEIAGLAALKKTVLTTRFKNADNDSMSLKYDEIQISAINHKILLLKEELGRIGKEKEDARLEYIDALKEKKVLEKLRIRKESEYRKNQKARESRTVDDLALTNIAANREVSRWD